MSDDLAAAPAPAPTPSRHPHFVRWGLAGVTLAACAACFAVMRFKAPPADVGSEKLTASGDYRVRLEPLADPVPVRTIHEWRVVIQPTRSDVQRPSHAAVAFNGSMPLHRHGLPTRPQTAAGDSPGELVVEGVKFSMRGWWRLVVYVRRPQMLDSVVFNLAL